MINKFRNCLCGGRINKEAIVTNGISVGYKLVCNKCHKTAVLSSSGIIMGLQSYRELEQVTKEKTLAMI